MGIICTTASLLARIRSATDRTVDPALDTTVDLMPWLNEAARELQVLVAKIDPDEYAAVSSSFSIPSGNTYDFAKTPTGTDGVAQATFMSLLGVEYTVDAGAHWKRLKKFRFTMRGQVRRMAYRRRKRTLIIEPAEAANTYPFRYWYVEAPEALTNAGGEDIDLPFGGDQYVIQHVACLVRGKFEEDPIGNLALKNAAEQTVRRHLTPSAPEVVREADPYDWDDE